jgi:hypothetical protein
VKRRGKKKKKKDRRKIHSNKCSKFQSRDSDIGAVFQDSASGELQAEQEAEKNNQGEQSHQMVSVSAEVIREMDMKDDMRTEKVSEFTSPTVPVVDLEAANSSCSNLGEKDKSTTASSGNEPEQRYWYSVIKINLDFRFCLPMSETVMPGTSTVPVSCALDVWSI